MKLNFYPTLLLFTAALLLAAPLKAQDTNGTNAVTRDELTSNYLQIQEQLHATQLAIEQNQEVAMESSQSNALVLTARLQSLEEAVAKQASDAEVVARQRAGDVDAARKTEQLTIFVAGAFGLIGLGIMLLMVYFQWRAFTQLAQISGRQHAMMTNGDAVHELAAPGRATVEASTAQLLNVVGRLEQRINELESGQKLLPEIASVRPTDLLGEGQKYLDGNQPQKALECFDKFVASNPSRADALVKRATALEKLGRDDEALSGYNRAISMDSTLVIAHLHKGGLLNRLRRYDEALNCYEQALVGQEKKARV